MHESQPGASRNPPAEGPRTAEQIRAEREQFRVTLSSIGDAVIATDTAGRVSFVNPVAERLTRWTADEALGRPLTEVFNIVHETTRQPAESPALRALREGTVVGLANHTVLLARDGTEVPIDDSAAPMRDEAGTPIGAVMVFRDVTDRRRAQEAQARLAAIVESSDDAIVGKTLDGVITSWNAGAERVFGYTAAEAVGRNITFIIPPERLDEERAILARLRRGERVGHFETVRVAKDGRRLDISLTVSPVTAPDGTVIGASKVARDITDQRRATAALRESEARYRAIVEASPECVKLVAPDGTLLQMNPAGLAMVEADESALGQSVYAVIAPEHREAFRAFNERVCRGEGGTLEFDVVGLKGTRRHLETTAVPLPNPGGGFTHLGITRDMTARTEAERALRESDRRKDDFIALLAHELRNPLAPVRNGLQVIRLSPDRPVRERAQEMMERQLTHMVRLIDDLLDVSRISRNKVTLRRERVRLADVVTSAVEAARPLIDAAGHYLSVDLPPEPVYLDADHTRLAQVFSNLLTNSAKYTEPGGRIALAAEVRDGAVTVTVTDTGIGIPADALPTIFDMFSQVDRGTERTAGGLGIGLALVKGLVEMHGGAVAAESPGPCRGSTFRVTLPVAEPQPGDIPATGEGDRREGAGRRVLVVDDNEDGAVSMATMLQLLGDEVRTAHDGVEAVEAARAFRPEVILMDVGMPRLDGYEATRRIRGEPWGAGVTVIAVTGWGHESDRERSRAAGCDAHLVKPVNLADLDALLTDLRGPRPGATAGRGHS
jgi:PAS domain S-box-containing protein